MRKALLSSVAAMFCLIGITQTPCANSFSVLRNGAGSVCPADFPGNTLQAANSTYHKDGLVEIRFTSMVGEGITPTITAIRIVTSPVGQPVVTGPNLDMRFSLKQFVPGTNRTIAEYCFYSKNNLNMDNGSGVRYQVDVNYFSASANTTSTCEIQQGEDQKALAVLFKSFTAKRYNGSTVKLTWTTATEQNSMGFYIQKNNGGAWKTAALVFSQAQNGGAGTELAYTYTDANNEKGISQYRLQQVGLDGKISYSDIRAIGGEETIGKVVVYPNPGTNGKVNVLLEESTSAHNIEVINMQGSVVKTYPEVADNPLVIEGLKPGLYAIKIMNRSTAVSSFQKVVIR